MSTIRRNTQSSDPSRSARQAPPATDKQQLALLFEALCSEDADEKEAAMRDVEQLGPAARPLIGPLRMLLRKDPDEKIRARAVQLLIQIAPRPSVVILPAVQDESPLVRIQLARYMAEQWVSEESAFTATLRRAGQTHLFDRIFGLIAAFQRGDAARYSPGVVVRSFLSPNPHEGEREERSILHLLRDEDLEIRKCAFDALEQFPWKSERLEQALLTAVRDNELFIRERALKMAEAHGNSQFRLLRAAAADQSASEQVRTWALKKLSQEHGNKAFAFFVTLQRNQEIPPGVRAAAAVGMQENEPSEKKAISSGSTQAVDE